MTTETERALERRRDLLRRWIPGETAGAPTRGVDHVAIFAKDLEATAAFYSTALGMPMIGVTANRDVPESTHMNVDVGSGMMISFFRLSPRTPAEAPRAGGGR